MCSSSEGESLCFTACFNGHYRQGVHEDVDLERPGNNSRLFFPFPATSLTFVPWNQCLLPHTHNISLGQLPLLTQWVLSLWRYSSGSMCLSYGQTWHLNRLGCLACEDVSACAFVWYLNQTAADCFLLILFPKIGVGDMWITPCKICLRVQTCHPQEAELSSETLLMNYSLIILHQCSNRSSQETTYRTNKMFY